MRWMHATWRLLMWCMLDRIGGDLCGLRRVCGAALIPIVFAFNTTPSYPQSWLLHKSLSYP